MMGLFEENDQPCVRDGFIAAEEKRRTAWTCFLMDSLLSGGKRRKRTLSADEMRIQLPCDTDYFYFGEPVHCETIQGAMMGSITTCATGRLGILAYTMLVSDIWGAVAQWVGLPRDNHESLGDSQFEAQRLLNLLNQWRTALPYRLQYEVFTLRAQHVSHQGQAFCYMHAVYFMSIMFLHRAFLPEPESLWYPDRGLKRNRSPQEWQQRSRGELLQASSQVCEMFEEIQDYGLVFLRGLVPWNGFTIYSAIGILLYFHYFPDDADNQDLSVSIGNHITKGCSFLKQMRDLWPMADAWVSVNRSIDAIALLLTLIARFHIEDARVLQQHQDRR